jgi:hypothetical protein
MAEVNKSDRSSLSCRILFRTAFLAFLCAAPLLAQKTPEPSLPKYDLHTESKMKGTVEEVRVPPKGREKEIAHLLLKTDADTVDVYLCHNLFLWTWG